MFKKFGNPSGLPSFFRTPITQNRWAVALAAKSIAAIASALAAQNGARHFAARNRAAGCPAALRRALFAPGKFYLPGPRSQTPDRTVCSKAPLGPLPPAATAKLLCTSGKAIFDAEQGKSTQALCGCQAVRWRSHEQSNGLFEHTARFCRFAAKCGLCFCPASTLDAALRENCLPEAMFSYVNAPLPGNFLFRPLCRRVRAENIWASHQIVDTGVVIIG